MRPSQWPEWLEHVWAKSPNKGEGNQPESLAQHTWFVLERLNDFIQLRPNLPAQLGKPDLWHILFWSAFFHDFGKALAGFQAMLHAEGKQRWGHRHEVFSLAFVEWIALALSSEEHQWLVAAIVSHHKDAAEIEINYPSPDEEDEDPITVQLKSFDKETIRGLWRWVHECSQTWIDALGLGALGVRALPFLPEAQAVAEIEQRGASHIRKRLGLYQKLIQNVDDSREQALLTTLIALRGHLINADHSASAHAGRMPRLAFDSQAILASRKLAWGSLFRHQRVAGETEGDVLLTAPTGSGKTEAALLWASRQAQGHRLPRLFYTLPYQASMNAMFLRLEQSFGKDHVGLQHGRGLLALYRMLMEREYDPGQAARQARWAKNLAGLNFTSVRVFSPYQMLKGVYRLKGYEALLTDYHGAAFIFDEIHAYEVERLAMILKLMEHLRRNYGARFLVMSATFPTIIKQWLGEALDTPTEIHATPELFQEFQRHRLHLLPGELLAEESLTRIAETARRGKSVLIACNTVKRAQNAYNELVQRLKLDGVPVELLHGRFNMRDRSAKERLVREAVGARNEQRRAMVLVATQVVEVSLDIDLDTIFSDPAPLEALVQRFGRINRARKQKGLASVHVYREPADGQKIYDPALIERTLHVLEREDDKPVDESAVGVWLDEIYSGNLADQWQRKFAECATEFEAACLKTLRPFQSLPHLEDKFYAAFDGTEVLPEVFEDEYNKLKEDDPILANELFVPISYRQLKRLKAARRLLDSEEQWPMVVDVPYSSELGLDFSKVSSGIPKPMEWID